MDALPLPTVTEALGVKPLEYADAARLMRQVSGAVLCAVVRFKDGSKQVRNLGAVAVRADASKFPKGSMVTGYVVARNESSQAAARDDAHEELLDRIMRESRQGRTDWALKHLK
jgi:hypothetical protein